MLLPLSTETESSSKPVANLVIIALTCLLYFLGFNDAQPASALVLRPDEGFRLHQLVTHVFAHASSGHLLGNMFLLFVIGNPVNRRLGSLRYTMLYLALGVLAGAAWFAVGVGSGLLGASGAVMGMVGMFLVLFPANRIHSLLSWLTLAMLAVAIVWLATGNEVRSVAFAVTLIAVYLIGLFVLIPRALATGGSVLSEVSLIFLGLCTVRVTGIWLVLATVGFDVYYLVSHAADGVAHEAHIAGALAGVLLGAGLAAMGRIRGTTDEPTLYELLGFATPMASPERPAAAAPTPVAAKIPATRQYKRVPYRRQAKRREVPYEQWVAETRRIRRGGGKATRPRRQRHSSGSFAA